MLGSAAAASDAIVPLVGVAPADKVTIGVSLAQDDNPFYIAMLRGIRALLYLEGFTIKGVQKVLRDRGLRYVAEFGRGEIVEKASSRKLAEFIAVPEEPQFARAALAVLEQARDDVAPDASAPNVDPVKTEHAKLQLLLAELEHLKVRLESVRSRLRG